MYCICVLHCTSTNFVNVFIGVVVWQVYSDVYDSAGSKSSVYRVQDSFSNMHHLQISLMNDARVSPGLYMNQITFGIFDFCISACLVIHGLWLNTIIHTTTHVH